MRRIAFLGVIPALMAAWYKVWKAMYFDTSGRGLLLSLLGQIINKKEEDYEIHS